MNTLPSTMEVHIHLVNGHTHRFTPSTPEAVAEILTLAQPSRVFTPRTLLIAGVYSSTAYPTCAIARIDLLMEGIPDWPYHHGASDIVEITEAQFRQRYRPEDEGVSREERRYEPGQAIVVFGEIEFVNGQRLYVEVHTSAENRTAIDQGIYIQQLFQTPGLHCRRHGGGVCIVNPANVVRFTFYPGPPKLPTNAWDASRVGPF